MKRLINEDPKRSLWVRLSRLHCSEAGFGLVTGNKNNTILYVLYYFIFSAGILLHNILLPLFGFLLEYMKQATGSKCLA